MGLIDFPKLLATRPSFLREVVSCGAYVLIRNVRSFALGKYWDLCHWNPPLRCDVREQHAASNSHRETKYQVIGQFEGRETAVACAIEGTLCRIISARQAGRTNDGPITVISRSDRAKGKTGWARVDALTDAEIAAAVRGDPDAVPLGVDWSKAQLVTPPKKTAISIRVDEDVLDYFKQGGAGYQGRMNAVLRHFVEERRKKEQA